MSAFYADERQQYKTAIDNFLFSLQFTDGPQPLITQSKSLEGGGIKAVWRGISMNVSTATTSQPIGLGYNVFTPIFLSNGQAYFGPKFYSEGLNDVDTRVLAELYRRDWGTYTFSTGRGVFENALWRYPTKNGRKHTHHHCQSYRSPFLSIAFG